MTTALQALAARLVGHWTAEATHTLLPGVAIAGTASVELLGDDGFLLHRTWYDHPQMPDAVSLLRGDQLHYFDTRGVLRVFALTVTRDGWSVQRPQRGDDFGQRTTWVVDGAGTSVHGRSQLSHDGVQWEDDLEVVYRRAPAGPG